MMLMRLAFVVACLGLAPAEPRPPNFVIIFADDLGYNDLGCYGSKLIRTPRLDRMAVEGMRFTNFYAQPICGPSRAAIMTGCYPLRVAERRNVKDIHPVLHDKEITIAELLKPLGYATGCFGKWDLARHSQKKFEPDLMPNGQGFDTFFGTPTSNDGFVDLYRNRKLVEPKADMKTLTRRYTDEAIAFIEQHKDRPFFVYLPHTMPHTRLAASDRFRGKSPRGLYGDVVEEIDFNAGRLLDVLKRLGLEKNTYVMFTSDNGPWLIKNRDKVNGSRQEDHGGSAHPLRSGKVSTWEGGLRVPCLLWAPGRVPAGSVCDAPSSTLDVLPTLTALAGTAPPGDRVIDGRDISPLMRGEEVEPRPFFYYLRTHLQAVRLGRWKLHLPRPPHPPWLGPFARNAHIAPEDDIGIKTPLLFDLETDIGEKTDVAEKHPDVVARLLKLAEDARDDIGDYNRIGRGARFFDKGPKRPGCATWLAERK